VIIDEGVSLHFAFRFFKFVRIKVMSRFYLCIKIDVLFVILFAFSLHLLIYLFCVVIYQFTFIRELIS